MHQDEKKQWKEKGQRKKTIMFYKKEDPFRQINHYKGQKLSE